MKRGKRRAKSKSKEEGYRTGDGTGYLKSARGGEKKKRCVGEEEMEEVQVGG